MTWKMYRWIWQLRAPLHIGYTPAGALNRTRLYIPARNMWAAFTAEISRRQAGSAFPNYGDIGRELQEHVGFTYLFPAEWVKGRWYAWLPRYEEENGLCWHREDGQKELDRRFRRRLLHTRPSTAIAPGSGAAEEGTLREVEYITTYWKPAQTSRRDLSPVAFVGYVFLKRTVSQMLKDVIKDMSEVFIGGEIRYGFGRLTLVSTEDPWEPAFRCFSSQVDLKDGAPRIFNPDYLLAHSQVYHIEGYGDREVLSRWDWTRRRVDRQLYWKPGTQIKQCTDFVILPEGIWAKVL